MTSNQPDEVERLLDGSRLNFEECEFFYSPSILNNLGTILTNVIEGANNHIFKVYSFDI